MNNPSMATKGKPGARSVRARVSQPRSGARLKCPADMVPIKHPVWNVWFCGTRTGRRLAARRAAAHKRGQDYLAAHGIRPGIGASPTPTPAIPSPKCMEWACPPGYMVKYGTWPPTCAAPKPHVPTRPTPRPAGKIRRPRRFAG